MRLLPADLTEPEELGSPLNVQKRLFCEETPISFAESANVKHAKPKVDLNVVTGWTVVTGVLLLLFLVGMLFVLANNMAANTLAIELHPLDEPTLNTKSYACHPSYPDLCLPANVSDLNCRDIAEKNFRVLPPDPFRLDGDKDGWGCESK